MGQTAQKIFDQALRRQIHIGRFTRKLGKESTDLLRLAEREIYAKLASNELTEFGKKRFENMLRSIRETHANIYAKSYDNITRELRQFTKDELRFNARSLQKAYPIKIGLDRPAPGQVFAAAMAKPFEGAVLKDWMEQLGRTASRKVEAAIKIGFIEGESLGQMTRRLRDVFPTSRRGLEALVRTAVSHTSTVARENLYAANKDLFKGVKWVSTLDGRTTPICQKRDGKIYKMEEGPRPPAHWACRSTTVPVTKSWKELGLDDLEEGDKLSKRPFVVDRRRVRDIPKGQRNIGVTAADETYPKWLKRQPAKFVDNVLGRTRGKLFREGVVTLEKFSDPLGKMYTLDELRKREDLLLEGVPVPKAKIPGPTPAVEELVDNVKRHENYFIAHKNLPRHIRPDNLIDTMITDELSAEKYLNSITDKEMRKIRGQVFKYNEVIEERLMSELVKLKGITPVRAAEISVELTHRLLGGWVRSSSSNSGNLLKELIAKRKKVKVTFGNIFMNEDPTLLAEFAKEMEHVRTKLGTLLNVSPAKLNDMLDIFIDVHEGATQAILKNLFQGKKIKLYRGQGISTYVKQGLLDINKAKDLDGAVRSLQKPLRRGMFLDTNSLSSWTLDVDVAGEFGDVIVEIEVNAKDLFMGIFTDTRFFDEREMILKKGNYMIRRLFVRSTKFL